MSIGNLPQVSILIPHYRTLDLTKLCLRSLKKHTDLSRVQVIVIDNGSKDASTEYLRSLNWITLIEREPIPGESGARAHSRALDLGLSLATAPYVLSIHTDTIVTSPHWLDYLLRNIEADPHVAGVGSWKLEFKPWYKRSLKALESVWQILRATLLKLAHQRTPSKENNHYFYLRSHCALYRTDLLHRFKLSFDENDVAGKVIHKKLLDQGYDMKFLDIHGLSNHLRHINHATVILNPELAGRKTGKKSERRRVRRELESFDYQLLLKDEGLDN